MTDHELQEQLRRPSSSRLNSASADRIHKALIAEYATVTFSPQSRYKGVVGIYPLATRPMVYSIIASFLVAFVLGTTTVANAAKPGDFLFGWDTATEHVRHALTVGQQAKAEYEAKVAEERIAERMELESEHSEHAEDAARLSDDAVKNALTTISRLRSEGKGNDDVLSQVESRLRSLEANDDHAGRLEVKVETENGIAKVRVEFERNRWEWNTTTTETEALLKEMASKTGLSIELLRLGYANNGDRVNFNTNGNANGNVNGTSNTNTVNRNSNTSNRNTNSVNRNSNVNTSHEVENEVENHNGNSNVNSTQNTNSVDDSADDITSIRVVIDSSKGIAKITIEEKGVEQEWSVNSTVQSVVLADIMAKTGMSSAQITTIWTYSTK
jgi:hypothetical protein